MLVGWNTIIQESLEAKMSDSESALFKSLAKKGIVRREALLEALKERGILEDDPRVRSLLKGLNGNSAEITEAQFQILYDQAPGLLDQALIEGLVVPDFKAFTAQLTDIYDEVNTIRLGKLPTYIPQLERVDPEKFAVSICTVDGQRFSVGDSDDYFCVQSCSKPMTYCLALEEQGEDVVHSYVGREPSGKTFNELTLNTKGLPHNPMINAGAIMCGALIKRGGDASDRFDYVMEKWNVAAGGQKIGFNNAVYLSERQTADRNFALGYFMREKKAFPPDVELLDVLEFYFQCCSIETTTKSMAIIASTLANGGICPLTGVQVFQPGHVKNCLSLMLSCGMYDFSGEFAFTVGIPAKSGVSGAIMLAIPNLGGITVWSPLLDELGNSVRGVEFCKRLVSRFKFHTFDSMLGLGDTRLDPRRKR
ncbi:MAG: glutaminase A [Candidatus Melainabacteria bacterium]|nr:glutaminase A [Candidatus Melainabacteria bacterium]